MKLLWLYLLAYLFLPIIGEIRLVNENIAIPAGESSWDLILHNTIFVIVILFVAYFVQSYKSTLVVRKTRYPQMFIKKVFRRAKFIAAFSIIIIFLLSGYKVIFEGLNRGEIRSGLGLFGPLYTFLLLYLSMGLIIFISVIYRNLDINKKYHRKDVFFLYIFAILLGLMSGYKSVTVQLLVPGLVVLYITNIRLLKLIWVVSAIILVIIFFTMYVRHIGFIDAVDFFIYRITVMTAYGVIGVWNVFDHPATFSDILKNFLGIFGEKIASFLLAISPHEPEFLKTNLSRYITYLVYPDVEGALSNSVNVTVSSFGHAVYLFGKELYYFYALIMGVIIGIFIRFFKKYVMKGCALLASLFGTYFFAVILPSLNSGGIFLLVSIPVIFYMFLVFIVIKYFVKG